MTAEQLREFLEVMERRYPQNYPLTMVLACTGLRFSHAPALKWADLDEERGVLRTTRKQVRGRVGPVSRRKRAPREMPLHSVVVEILRSHRTRLLRIQARGLAEGWMFPSRAGTLRTPASLKRAWVGCLKEIGYGRRFTVHGLRRTFNDLTRQAGVDSVVISSLTGHSTETMRIHYSTVALEEKRRAVAGVVQLVTRSGADLGADGGPEADRGRAGADSADRLSS